MKFVSLVSVAAALLFAFAAPAARAADPIPADGSVVASFAPADIGTILAAAPDATGRLLVLTSTALRRIGADGVVEPTTSFGLTVATATSVLPLADGHIYVGGNFSSQTHEPSGATSSISLLLRLNADATGTADTSYSVSFSGSVTALAAGASGTFYAGTAGAPTSANGIQRFLPTGLNDTSFAPAVNTVATGTSASVQVIREQPDGKVLVAYTNGNPGSITWRIARLTATGALDTTFGTNGILLVPLIVRGLDLLPDGRIAVAGSFATLAGAAQQFVGLLLPDGTADPTFQFNGVLNSNALGVAYRDGRLLVWGPFTAVNGATQTGLARLNLDGSVDATFSVGVGGDNSVNTALYTATGEIFIGGSFTSFKDVSRNRAALLVGNPQIGAIGFAPPRVNALEDAAPLTLTLRRYGPAAEAAAITYATVDGTATAGTDFAAATGTVNWAAGEAGDKTVAIALLDNAGIHANRAFRVVLSDPTGPVGPAASATITLIDDDAPATITTQPTTSTSLYESQALVLSVVATSPSALTYQWFRNGVAIPGASSATYNVASVLAAQSGVYQARVTNASGDYFSAPALVSVRPQSGRPAAGQAAALGRPTFGTAPVGLVVANDGYVYIGGSFNANPAGNVPKACFIRVKPDGSTDLTYTYNPVPLEGPGGNNVSALARQRDGKILIAGGFPGRVVRLNADGTPDTAFTTALGSSLPSVAINDFAFDSTGRIYLGGASYLARLSSAGVRDAAYSSPVNGTVTAIAVQATDDKLLVAGSFTSLAGSAASGLGRLNTNGARDTAFVSAIGGSANYNDLLVLADGRILAPGSNFTNGSTLALVNADGSFGSNIASTNQVYQLAQAPGGKVLRIQTSSNAANFVARLLGTNPLPSPGSADGDATFNLGTGPNGEARALAIGPDGGVWIAGQFATVNGVATGGIAKLNGDPIAPAIVNQPANTGVSAGATAHLGVGTFGTGITYQWFKNGQSLSNSGHYSGTTTAVLTVSNVALADDANYTVQITGGSPSSTVTSAPAHLHVLGAPVVAAPPAAAPLFAGANLTLAAETFALAPATYVWRRDGVLITDGGRFSGATTAALAITGATVADTGSYTLAVTNALGTATSAPVFVLVNPIAASIAPLFSGLASTANVRDLLVLPDGRMLVAGNGALSNGASIASVAALALVNPDGTVSNLGRDPATNAALPSINGAILDVVRQTDGKFVIGGTFTTVNGVAINRVARLHPDGTLDSTFNPGSGAASDVNTLGIDPSGRILVGGLFTDFAGVTGQSNLVRLQSGGAVDTSFAPAVGVAIYKLLPLADGGFLISGGFNGPGQYLRRYNSAGAMVTYYANPLSTVTDIALAPDGVSFYASHTGTPYLARYPLAGSVDRSFAIPSTSLPNGTVNRIVVQSDGAIVALGNFTSPRTRIARFLPSGRVDSDFLPGTGFPTINNTGLALDATGRIWVGGFFTTFNSAPAACLTVLNGTPVSLGFARHPAACAVEAGQTATFSAEVVATAAVTYRWFKDNVALADGGRFSGTTTATLTITGATLADEGPYTVSATTTPAGTRASLPADLIFLAAPEIVTLPAGRTASAGAVFAAPALVRGASTLNYQWLRGGTPVSGQTTATLAFTSPATTDTGWYQLRVTNTLGTVTSAPVLFTFAQYAGGRIGGLAVPSITNNIVIATISPLADGGVFLAGGFTGLTPPGGTEVFARGFARLGANGSLSSIPLQAYNNYPSFGTSFAGTGSVVVQDSQGRLLFAGGFDGMTTAETTGPRRSPTRLLANGTADSTWTGPTAAGVSGINALAVDASDNIYIGGNFGNINGVVNTTRIARLGAATGALDTAFASPITTGTVSRILVLSDGRLLVGGTFGIRLLETTGALAADFAYTGANVNSLAALPGGDFLVAASTGLQRITSAGTLVSPFPATGTAANASVVAIQPLADGRFVVAGNFNTYNGVSANYIAAINADGTPSTGFAFGSGFNGNVTSLALDGAARLWVGGGGFTTYNGATAGRLVALATSDFTPETPPEPAANPFLAYLEASDVPEGQRGPTDDPDADSVPNLLEFALGGDPMSPGGTDIPVCALIGGDLTLTYDRAEPASVTYVVETTTDLANPASWTTTGVTQGTPAGDGLTTASVPLDGPGRFLRLRATLLAP